MRHRPRPACPESPGEPTWLRRSRAIAWTGFVLGAASGIIMGLWAFDGPLPAPGSLVDYGETARRFLRLGHIAFFGLGYLNLLLVAEIPNLPLGDKSAWTAGQAMNLANIAMPLTLLAAAFWPLAKYLLCLPATAAALALAVVAWGAIRRAAVNAPLHLPETRRPR